MFYKPTKIPGLAARINSVRSFLYILMAIGSITPCIADCNTTQWWTDPCNNKPLQPSLMEKFRHGRSVKHRGVVIEQLKRSINRSSKLLKDIERIYINESESVKHQRENIEWLNAVQMIRNISSPRKFVKKLRKLHPNLQRFAGTLEVLLCTPIHTQGHFDRVKREKIIHEAKNNLRAFICEVNEAIPARFRRKISLEKMKINLPDQMNLTDSYFFDVQILKNLKWFFTQLKIKALRTKKRPRNQFYEISKT